MQAELKIQERETEKEQPQEMFIEKVVQTTKIEELIILQIRKDLETKLISELQKKLQLKQLEKKIIEEEETKQTQEEKEEQREVLHGYSIEFETFYSKEQGVYQVKQLYEQNHGNQTSYEK